MGQKDLSITVPSFFKCPISLDVMKSPVSLSTGVTYDRTSIQRWLDGGNNTCPVTMQVLDTKDFVPNHTLQRLIQIWSINSTNTRLHATNSQQQFHSLSTTQVLELINRVLADADTRLESFIKILCFATESLENRKFLASSDRFISLLVNIIASEGPDLAPDLLEAILKILQVVITVFDNKQKETLLTTNNFLTSLGKILKTGLSDSRVAIASILEAIATDLESKKVVFENNDVLYHMLEILRSCSLVDTVEMHTVLSCLTSLSTPRRNKVKLVRAGGVKIISNFLSSNHKNITKACIDQPTTTVELLLTLLEMLVGCTEGRAAITEDPNCVQNVVQKIMKGSRAANEHAVALLWSLCYLFRDQRAKEAVRKSNGGLTKILLMMQSDCSPGVNRMCCDLLRIFRVNSKSCLYTYDTNTTHIMPC